MIRYHYWNPAQASDFFAKAGFRKNIEEEPTVFDRIRYLSSSDVYSSRDEDFTFVAALDDKKVVGWCTLQQNPYEAKNLWLTGLSVDVHYRNQGIGGKLLTMAFEQCQAQGKALELSSYTFFGKAVLEKKMEACAKQFPGVPVITSELSHSFPTERDKEEAYIMGFDHPMLDEVDHGI